MATAILQLDIDRLPPAVDVSKEYPQALVLVRRRGIPVGQFYVPVRAGSLDMESCARSLAIATRRRRWQWEVDDYLGPADAIGPRLGTTGDYELYKLRAGLPGPQACTREMIQTVTKVR